MIKKIKIFIIFLISVNVTAERIKDIANISGIRSNQLVGYGLVVGLDGSGDNTSFTSQSFKTMLSRLGVQLPDGITATSKNIAAVALNAELPAFAKPGQNIDVTVSSIGDAKSLRGGVLLLSELKGPDGRVYALAQGSLVVSGFGASGDDGSKIKVNVPVVGRIPNGATIEVPSPSVLSENLNTISYLLHRSDFTTATRMSDAINKYMGKGTATPLDAGTVKVNVPVEFGEKVDFLAALENIRLSPGEEAAKVIVNSRTGTIVIGKNVTVGPAAVSHGSLVVTIKEKEDVSQPLPDSQGTTETIKDSEVSFAQENGKMFYLRKGVSLNKIVRAINEIGASPGDLMAILESLKQAGALNADLEVI